MCDYLYSKSLFHSPILKIENTEKREKILQILDIFKINMSKILRIMNIFEEEMKIGLSKEKRESLQMENTFISKLPNGNEKGDFLSLDLGSTNFRIILSKLDANEKEDEFIVKYYDIPLELKIGDSFKLFDHIATCIQDFVKSIPELSERRIPLGFTFSFPMVQKDIDVGILVTWTKCYDLPDLIGKDVVQYMQKAINDKGLNVDIVAILNDTTGTLVKGAYLDKDCCVGLILGTGFNACYLEKSENVENWTNKEKFKEVVIDIECGAFGDNGSIDFIKSDIDFQVDSESLFSGSFTFEKLFSGNFVGDVMRRVLLLLVKEKLIFNSRISDQLMEKDAFSSSQMSLIEGENRESIETKKAIESLGYFDYTEDDIIIVEYVCALLTVRGASLVSALMAQLILYLKKDNVVIAIDGSMYQHPKYKILLEDFISLLAPGKRFSLMAAKDGSGKGAGLVAAIAYDIKNA